MSVGVIVCTLNRSAELHDCLVAIAHQTMSARVVAIIDASESTAFGRNAETIAQCAAASAGIEFIHVSAPPGLTHQRNLGAAIVGERCVDWVQFVDDDVVLAADYLERIERQFGNPKVVGAEGRDTNLLGRAPRAFRLLYPRLSKLSGLSKTGHNWFPEAVPGDVDWLSGCAPAYRRDILTKLAFDERREGNGIGEDVDFSFRAGRLGALRHDPEATYAHRPSQINRDSGVVLARQVIGHRGWLASDFPRSFAAGWVRYGLLVEGAWSMAASTRRRDRERWRYGKTLLWSGLTRKALTRKALTRKALAHEHAV
jgi:GT2 family glycosyltransferase